MASHCLRRRPVLRWYLQLESKSPQFLTIDSGYLNGVIGSVGTMLQTLYPQQYKGSSAQSNVASITFAGTVLGTLIFGYTSDHNSRKWSLVASTLIIILFAILGTASYGANGSIDGLFAALTAYRFFLGIGIGGRNLRPRTHNRPD